MADILVVEDDKLLGQALAKSLESAGFRVFWARSSAEAEDAISAREYRVVFLDIMLPGEIDGVGLVSMVRTSSLNSKTYIVMLSNLGQMSDIERAMDSGANDYLVKANTDLEKIVAYAKSKVI